MATKKTTRKTAKKSGAKKKATKKKVAKKKTSGKKASSRRSVRASGTSRAKKAAKKSSSPRKKKVAKKKAKKKVVRKKPTKAERRATHGTRRKPSHGGRERAKEILDYFDTGALKDKTEGEIVELKMAFLRAYAKRGIVRDGTIAAGISWGQYHRWRETDEGFNTGCKAAEAMAEDFLESEAHRRAVEGFDRPVIYQGEITDTYTDYSDTLMAMLLKGYKKDKYKDRKEHSTPPGQPLKLEAETKDSVVSSILGMITNKPDPE